MNNDTFSLDNRIKNDSIEIGDLELCHVRLLNNCAWPWLLLLPKKNGLKEITDLNTEEQQCLMKEIDFFSRFISTFPNVEKINIGMLGNIVSQLHIHVIGRNTNDPAWPGPVWGCKAGEPYNDIELNKILTRFKNQMDNY